MPGGKMPMQGMGGQGMGGQGMGGQGMGGMPSPSAVPWPREVQVVPTWAHGLAPQPGQSLSFGTLQGFTSLHIWALLQEASAEAGGMGPGGMGQGGMGAGGMGGGMGAGGGMGYGGMAAPAPAPSAPVANPGPGMGPAPRVNVNAGMPPAPNVGGMGGGMGGMGAPGGGMGGGAPQMGMGGNTGMGGGGMGGYSHTGAATPVGYHQQGAMGMGASPHSSQHGSGFGMPPARSGGGTAPTASAMPVVDGLPVCWPLPTKAMQRLSTNQSVAGANMAIQELSSGGAYVIGEPMAAHDLAQVRNVFTMLLDSSSQDGNVKKREDISKRMDELYAKLQCSPEPSAMQYCSGTFCGLCPWIGFLLATVVVRYTMSCPRHHTFSMTLPRCYCALGLSVANN
ncbi:unnamed protein product [Polarella glacialis]|uniref:Uncharacterized protein n=1 Tax=Polarella glacialis TaxID=89957 RepID=A0A813KEW1_POLGL|nr:unnamed protein product [Polarella glacialis]